jgi:hypothetical protein
MLFMHRLELSCIVDFFVCIFKTRVEYGFLLNPPVAGTVNSVEEKTRVFFKLPRILSRHFFRSFVFAALNHKKTFENQIAYDFCIIYK